MDIQRVILPILALAAAFGASYVAREFPLSNRPSSLLVRQLNDPEKRSDALFTLLRRTERSLLSRAEFLRDYDDFDVILCPQTNGRLPVYLVISKPPFETSEEDAFPQPPGEIFPVGTFPRFSTKWENPDIRIFTSSGKFVRPDGILGVNGTLRDVNGDGTLESISILSDGATLVVTTMSEKPRRLLEAQINQEAKEWTYRLNEKGDIEVGPLTPKGFLAKSAFKWDRETNTFLVQNLLPHEHLRVLNPPVADANFNPLEFTPDPDAPAEPDWLELEDEEPRRTSFRSRSFASASNQEILREMSSQRRSEDGSKSSAASFWSQTPREAALAWVDQHRKKWHRSQFGLAVDESGGEPPTAGSITFSGMSSICYNSVSGDYYLKVSPKESYLAFAGSSRGGVVNYDWVTDRPLFDFRLCPLEYPEAKQILQTVWWLDQIRSKAYREESRGFFGVSSTADGFVSYVMRSENGAPIRYRSGISWSTIPSSRFSGEYNREAALNFAFLIIAKVLPEKLENRWSQFDPAGDQRKEGKPEYTAQALDNLRALIGKFLDLANAQETRISLDIVSRAAIAVAELRLVSYAPKLEQLKDELKRAKKPYRLPEVISDEHMGLFSKSLVENTPELRKRMEELDDEMAKSFAGADGGPLDHAITAIEDALEFCTLEMDAGKLFDSIVTQPTPDPAKLRLLAEMNAGLYLKALEHFLPRMQGEALRRGFEEMFRRNPERAWTLFGSLSSQQQSALIGSESAIDVIFRREGVRGLLHRAATADERDLGTLIRYLVPEKDPLRFYEHEVEDALIGWLEKSGRSAKGEAALALALRGRKDYADQIWETMARTDPSFSSYDMLRALSIISKDHPGTREKLQTWAAEKFQRGESLSETLDVVWANDLRPLRQAVEAIATGSTDDDENTYRSSKLPSRPFTSHKARKILRIWDETDPVAKAKMLASAAVQTYLLEHDRVLLEFAGLKLNPEQRRSVEQFVKEMPQLAEASLLSFDRQQYDNVSGKLLTQLSR